MLSLNDDCLIHIFQFLNLKEQLQLADVCQHFHYLIVKYIWPRKYREIFPQMKCLQPLTTEEYKKFLQYNSENIRKLEIEDTNNFAYAGYLYVNRFTVRPDYSFYFSLKMRNLKELYCQDQRIHDGYIRMLTKYCPKLEVLHLRGTHVTGAYITDFKCLRELQIGDVRFDYNTECDREGVNKTTAHVVW